MKSSPRRGQSKTRSAPPRAHRRDISIASHHPRLRLDRRSVSRAIHVLDEHHDLLATPASTLRRVPDGELSIVFLTDAALAQLHDEFFDDPTPTDVITFEGDPALQTAGEICVSADAAWRHVAGSDERVPAGAFSRELTLYLVHGWLHLAGHDDLVPAKKRMMRRAEAKALGILGSARALPAFTLRPTGRR